MKKIVCIRCRKSFSKGMKLCPFCNMPAVMPPTKDTAKCPRCKVALDPEVFRKVELDVCPSCSGMWLDTLDFEHLTSEKDVYADESTKTHYIPPALEPVKGYYECVRCDHLMHRVRFRNISNVLIDVCGPHGRGGG